MATLGLLGIILFCVYVIITICVFKIPESLSASYYYWIEKKQNWPFRVVLIVSAIWLMFPMIDLGKDSIWQFTGFLAPACLVFTGAAADFMNKKLVDKWLHPISACLCAVSSLVWQYCIAEMLIFLPISAIILLITSLLTKTLKRCYIFWLEMICFLSIFCCLIKIYYF